MKIGTQYDYGAWFYVPEQDEWYTAEKGDGPYYKEDDELSEKEANKLGHFRKDK